MSIEECKAAYQELSQTVFGDGTIRTTTRVLKTLVCRKNVDMLAYRYSRTPLETAVEQFLRAKNLGPNVPLLPGPEENIGRRCKV
jgi:hypothetical protein